MGDQKIKILEKNGEFFAKNRTGGYRSISIRQELIMTDGLGFTGISPEQIKRYVSRRNDDLIAGWKSLESNDWETLKTIGHRIKGNAASFGFGDLGKLGEALELAAVEKSRDGAMLHLQSLEAWLTQHQ